MKPGPVISASSTGLYVLTKKSLELCFDAKSLYLKAVTFLSMLMIEQKGFVKDFLYLAINVFLKFC